MTGTLESVSIYDGTFGQQISVNLKNDEGYVALRVSIFDGKQQVDNTYAESLIKLLPSLNKGDMLTISGYNFKPGDSPYSKIGISVKVSGEKIKSKLTNSYYSKSGELVPGDIPAILFKEKLGKKRPTADSIEAKDTYLLGILEAQESRLTWKNNSESQPSEPEMVNQDKPKVATPVVSEDIDDLPF